MLLGGGEALARDGRGGAAGLRGGRRGQAGRHCGNRDINININIITNININTHIDMNTNINTNINIHRHRSPPPHPLLSVSEHLRSLQGAAPAAPVTAGRKDHSIPSFPRELLPTASSSSMAKSSWVSSGPSLFIKPASSCLQTPGQREERLQLHAGITDRSGPSLAAAPARGQSQSHGRLGTCTRCRGRGEDITCSSLKGNMGMHRIPQEMRVYPQWVSPDMERSPAQASPGVKLPAPGDLTFKEPHYKQLIGDGN